MNPAVGYRWLVLRLVESQILGHLRPQRFTAAQQVLGSSERAVHVLGGERLHQTTERKIRHREARRLAADEQAWHAEIVEAHGDRETGRARAKWRSSRTRSGSCSSAAAIAPSASSAIATTR